MDVNVSSIRCLFLVMTISVIWMSHLPGQITIKHGSGGTTLIETGGVNTFLGNDAGISNFGSSAYSTGVGYRALKSNQDGEYNTAVGAFALLNNQWGDYNVAIGAYANQNAVQSFYNVAVGYSALSLNESGSNNVALGTNAISLNTTGNNNTGVGTNILTLNTTGNRNTGLGSGALFANSTGSKNTAVGMLSLQAAVEDENSALGYQSGFLLGSGTHNTLIGAYALDDVLSTSRTVAVGYNSGGDIEAGSYNTFIGSIARPLVANQINSTALGDAATVAASNQIRLGDTGVSWIGGQVNWSAASDARFKTDIVNSQLGLEFILNLRPVEYQMAVSTEKIDGNGHLGKIYTGFIAQEVEQTLRDLGAEFSGLCPPANAEDFYSLRYAEFVVPLVKAMQELKIIIDAQQAEIDAIRDQNEILQAAVTRFSQTNESR